MKTINKTSNNEIVIKNSKFITLLYSLKNEDEIAAILLSVKNEYKNATHYCYAYIIGDIMRSNDDGEPNGTAGVPILNVLKKNDLDRILCVVVRYFGGVKLGVGGLIRAYGKSVRETLKKAYLIDIEKYYTIMIKFHYNDRKKVDNLISNDSIISKEFHENIIYEFKLKALDNELINSLKLSGASIININRFLS